VSVQSDLFAVAFPTFPWMDSAACTDVDPELFFPTVASAYNSSEGVVPVGLSGEAAKRICRGCPVIGDCLAFALETGDKHAVLGGLTAAERGNTWRRGKKR
jgi:WhiB family redox-sensing transcriptional regulator